MDGKTLRTQLAFLLRESTSSAFLDEKTSYDFLYEAACAFSLLTQSINGTQSITSVASTSSYTLNADFLCLRVQTTERNQWTIKLNDGTSDYWISHRDYEPQYYANNTDETAIPDSFAITDVETAPVNLTGAASATASLRTT